MAHRDQNFETRHSSVSPKDYGIPLINENLCIFGVDWSNSVDLYNGQSKCSYKIILLIFQDYLKVTDT